MRWWVCGLLIAMACPALAADYDDSWLRGSQVIGTAPPPPPRLYRIWAGVYGGAQVAEDFHGVDFRGVPSPSIASAANQDQILAGLGDALPGMPALPSYNTKGPTYGGFLGYNWQIDDMVFGFELNANRSALNGYASNTATRNYIVTSGGYTYAPTTVNVTTSATADMSTYGTLRGRVGWALGNFLPYLVAGVSFAQIDTTRHVDINYFGVCVPQPPNPCPNITIGGDYPFSDASHGKYIAGFDAALGVGYLVTQNIFTRAEVEYLHLGTPNDIRLSTVSARVALGLKY
jgi:outer membrane immunogenic protein